MRLRTVLGFGVLTAAAALIGSRATKRSIDSRWYNVHLDKPSWQPPREAFGPVWTTLYALMAGSAARVYDARPSRERSRALKLWGAQLALNVAWSVIFFGARKPKLAAAEVGVLLATIALYMRASRKVDGRAMTMMAPYLAWTAFAAVLNGTIAKNN
jgi:tryptophan-rich sensory protein